MLPLEIVCILQLKNEENDNYEEIGRSERVENSLNPDFTTKMLLTYHFERKQALKFCLYDCDEGLSNPKKADELGSIKVNLSEIVQGHLRHGRLLDDSGNKNATLYVTARETVDCRQSYVFNFVGRKLDDKDFITKSDPFLVFHKKTRDGSFTPVGQTPVIRDDLNPNWPTFRINCATFCDNNPHLQLKIDCFDHERDGKHDLIGTFFTTAAELTSPTSRKEFELIHPKKKEKKSSYKHSGLIFLERYKLEEDWEFSHFVQAGLQLNFTVAIDFSTSNGDPSDQTSLHYFNPAYPFNQYTTAIDAVGQIVEDYDADKLFPVYGFGGQFFNSSHTQDCHPLNDNTSNPHVVGVQGILDAYRYALSATKLAQPTNFSHIINNATLAASEYQSGLHYFILLIITNGHISDMDKTKCAIVEASKYPLSIIIVGVGEGDFEAMHQLDSDMKMLRDVHGRKTQRDIVQFVSLREVFGTSFVPSKMAEYQRSLSKKVLAEVPKQVKLYMKFKGIRPIDVYNSYMIHHPNSTSASPIGAPTNAIPSHF